MPANLPVALLADEFLRTGRHGFPVLNDTRAEFMDVFLSPHSGAVGKTVAELDLPREAVLVSIRRGRELIIPHGDTLLQAGDVVTVLCEREYIHQLKVTLNQLDTTSSEQP